MKKSLSLLIATLVATFVGLASAAPPNRDQALQTAETYLRRVMGANSANAPVSKPTAAEAAALSILGAQVNAKEELEIVNWPNIPLSKITAGGDVRGVMGQLRNTGSFQTKSQENARNNERSKQLEAVKERSAGHEGKSLLSAEWTTRMKVLGLDLNENNELVVGDKTFNPVKTEAKLIAQAMNVKAAAQIREIDALLHEIRLQLQASQPAKK